MINSQQGMTSTEVAIIIPCPTSTSATTFSSKSLPKYRKLNQNRNKDTTKKIMCLLSIINCRAWYTMMANRLSE